MLFNRLRERDSVRIVDVVDEDGPDVVMGVRLVDVLTHIPREKSTAPNLSCTRPKDLPEYSQGGLLNSRELQQVD